MKHIVLSLALMIVGAPLVAAATPHCQPCPYTCADLGLGKRDCSQLSESRGLCCLDLTQRGLELAKEQERLLGSNKVATACPPGFAPSEQRCSEAERARGCRDQRVGPERRGCVTQGFR